MISIPEWKSPKRYSGGVGCSSQAKVEANLRPRQDPLQVGDLVLMLTPKGEDSLTCRWDGLFPVKQVLGEMIDAPYANGSRVD
jgi:hypothetical protein